MMPLIKKQTPPKSEEVVIEKTANNKAMFQLLCDIRKHIDNSALDPMLDVADISKRINAVLAQQKQ